MKRYYGWNLKEDRAMIAIITGEMADGTKVYTECDEHGKLLNLDNQYIRTLKHGSQIFLSL